jgi:hypothetical protein
MALEDVDQGVLGLPQKVSHAVGYRDEESDDHEQACCYGHVVRADHGERRDGSGVVGLLGEICRALPSDEAVHRKQGGQDEAVPEGTARRPLGRDEDVEAGMVVEEED